MRKTGLVAQILTWQGKPADPDSPDGRDLLRHRKDKLVFLHAEWGRRHQFTTRQLTAYQAARLADYRLDPHLAAIIPERELDWMRRAGLTYYAYSTQEWVYTHWGRQLYARHLGLPEPELTARTYPY